MSIGAIVLLLGSITSSGAVNFRITIQPSVEKEMKTCLETYSEELCSCTSKYVASRTEKDTGVGIEQVRKEAKEFCESKSVDNTKYLL